MVYKWSKEELVQFFKSFEGFYGRLKCSEFVALVIKTWLDGPQDFVDNCAILAIIDIAMKDSPNSLPEKISLHADSILKKYLKKEQDSTKTVTFERAENSQDSENQPIKSSKRKRDKKLDQKMGGRAQGFSVVDSQVGSSSNLEGVVNLRQDSLVSDFSQVAKPQLDDGYWTASNESENSSVQMKVEFDPFDVKEECEDASLNLGAVLSKEIKEEHVSPRSSDFADFEPVPSPKNPSDFESAPKDADAIQTSNPEAKKCPAASEENKDSQRCQVCTNSDDRPVFTNQACGHQFHRD